MNTRGHLTTQETEVQTAAESEDTRALSTHDLRKKTDESDNLTQEQKKKTLFHMLSKYVQGSFYIQARPV